MGKRMRIKGRVFFKGYRLGRKGIRIQEKGGT
jgi:hypothetical protein